MGRRAEEESVRKHVWLYRRDVERIHATFPDQDLSFIVRKMVRTVLTQAESIAMQSAAPLVVDHKGMKDIVNE